MFNNNFNNNPMGNTLNKMGEVANSYSSSESKNYEDKRNTNERKPLKMEISEPKEFDGVVKTKLMTTVNLSKLINSMLKTVFQDLEGSVILPDPATGALTLSLYFKDIQRYDNDKLKGIVLANQKVARNSTPMSQRISNFTMRSKNKTYDLSDDCKDILSEFIYVPQNKKINWNQYVCEQTQAEYGAYAIYVKVTGLDISRFIRKIYGAKDNEGNPVDYNISLIRPIGGNMYSPLQQNHLISIQQLNTKQVQELVKLVGMVPVTGGIPMVR